ncbi:MAG: PspA/IM30 family protein [Desertifilum sp. SIO1I2]|nr:PspA/IM30 family protein [Desertifilum sp. SIO1I2]
MGLMDRIGRVIKANLNSLVGNAEDPEKVLEQVVMDMQEDLIQMRQAVASAIATQKRTERQWKHNEATAQDWHRRAQLALQKGDETLAREALVRRQPYMETAEALHQQISQQSQLVNKLKQDMHKVERKLAEAKTKKDMYIARARSAKASQQINEMMGKLNPQGSLAAFDRMEEKVHQLEARAEAWTSLETDDLEKSFAALEGGSQVDAELATMKAKLGDSPSASLPQASEVDPELERLRAQIRDT